MSTLASTAKGPGQEILEDISAAQQYVLDLQVLFYSLKTVSANVQKEAEEAAVARKAEASARAGTGSPGAAAVAALQRQVDNLTQQLEAERRERARLQEQYDEAVAMLRKSYGQIVDDYLFATEQLHARTKQLEGLMEAASAGAAAAASAAAIDPPTRPISATCEYGDDVEKPLLPTYTLPRERQSQQQQQDELSGPWGSISPNFTPGRTGFAGEVSASPWETALPAPLSSSAAAVTPHVVEPAAAAGHRPFPSRHVTSGGGGAHAAAFGEVTANDATIAAGAPTASTSRTSSQGSAGAAGVSSAAGVSAPVAELQQEAASAPMQLQSIDQAVLSQRGKQGSGRPSTFTEGPRQACAPTAATPGPQARSPRAKVSSRVRAPSGGPIWEADSSPLSSPPGEAPRRQATAQRGDGFGPAGPALVVAPAQKGLASSSSAPSPARSLWSLRKEEPQGTASGARDSAGVLRGEVTEPVLASQLRRSLAGGITEAPTSGAYTGAGQRRGPAASESGFAHPDLDGGSDGPPLRSERLSEVLSAAVAGPGPRLSFSSFAGAGSGQAGASAAATTSVDGAQLPQPSPLRKPLHDVPDLADRTPERGRDRNHNHSGREVERTSRARSATQADVGSAVQPAAAAPPSSLISRSAQSAARAAAAELGSVAAAAAAGGRGEIDLEAWASERGRNRPSQSRGDDGVAATATFVHRDTGSSSGAAGQLSPHRQCTPPRGQQSQDRDRAGRHANAASTAESAAADASGSAAKRLRRSVSSPAERQTSRRKAAAEAAGTSPGQAVDSTAAPRSDGARRDPGASGSRRSTSRTATRPVPPTEAPKAAPRGGAGAVAGLAAAGAEPLGGGGGAPLSRRRSLRYVLSAFTPAAAADADSPGGASELPDPPAQAAKATPAAAAAAAAGVVDAKAGGGLDNRSREAAGSHGGLGPSLAADRAPGVTGGTGSAAATPELPRRERRTEPPPSGAPAPLDLDQYLASMRARYSTGPNNAPTVDAAAAGLHVGREAGGPQGSLGLGQAGQEQVRGEAGDNNGGGAGGGHGFGAPRSSVRVSADAVPYPGSASGSAGGGLAGPAVTAATTAAAAAPVASGPFSGRAAADAPAAPTATPVAPAGGDGEWGGSGDGGSSASSASIEGLASLVRSLRKRLAGMQQEYGIPVYDDDDQDFNTDDLSDGEGGGLDGYDIEDDLGGDDVDADAVAATAHDWRTDDELGETGDPFSGLGVDEDGGGDDFGDDGEESVLGRRDGADENDDFDAAYGYGGDVADDTDGGIGDADDSGNDVSRDTYDRPFSAVFSAAFDGVTARLRGSEAFQTAAAGRPYSSRDADQAPQGPARGGAAVSTSEDGHGNVDVSRFGGAWYGASGFSAGSSAAGTPRIIHDLPSHATADPPSAGGAGGGGSSSSATFDRDRMAAGAAGGKAAFPAFSRRSGGDGRTGLTSLLDAVNVAALGGAAGSARTSGGVGSTTTAGSAAVLHHVQGTGSAHERHVLHDRAVPAAPVPPPVQPAATWGGATGGVTVAMGPGSGPELGTSWSVGAQPDRVPQPDQTSPRKDSASAYGRAAAAAAGPVKLPQKWNAGDDRLAPEQGADAPVAATPGPAHELDAGGGVSNAAPRRAGGGGTGAGGGGGGVRGSSGIASADSAEARGVASSETSAAGASAGAPPLLQNLRSEAMFARIKQQLDELQSSFSAGLGLARGTDDAASAGTGATGGTAGSGGGFGRSDERRFTAAAPAGARPGDGWRSTEREVGSGTSSSGGGSGAGSAGGSDGARRAAWPANSDRTRGIPGSDASGSGKSGGSSDSGSNGGGLHGGKPIETAAAGAAQGRVPVWEDGSEGVSGAVLSGRADASGAQLHPGTDVNVRPQLGSVASRRKAASISLSAGFATAGGSGASLKPHGTVLQGDSDP